MTEKDYVTKMMIYLKRKKVKQVSLMDFFKEDEERWTQMQQVNMLRALKRSTAVTIDYTRRGTQLRTMIQLS